MIQISFKMVLRSCAYQAMWKEAFKAEGTEQCCNQNKFGLNYNQSYIVKSPHI